MMKIATKYRTTSMKAHPIFSSTVSLDGLLASGGFSGGVGIGVVQAPLWLGIRSAPFPQDHGAWKLCPYHVAYGECVANLGLSALWIPFPKNEYRAVLRG